MAGDVYYLVVDDQLLVPVAWVDVTARCDGAPYELCSGGVDEDGDGPDKDGDGYGVCSDCDDGDPAVSPAAVEDCDDDSVGDDDTCADEDDAGDDDGGCGSCAAGGVDPAVAAPGLLVALGLLAGYRLRRR